MRLKTLSLKNFLSYDSADLNLENLRKTLIVGMNEEDVSRSNGTGKTNLCEAIGWAVWGKSKAKTLDYNVKEGADVCSVTIEFEHDGRECTITRTRNRKNGQSTVDFILDEEPSNSSDLEKTNSKIEEFLRLDYDTYINSVYLKQDDIFSLANPQKSGDGRGILEKVLNLEEYDTYEKSSKIKIKDIELNNARITALIDSNKDVDIDISSNEDICEELSKESDLLSERLDKIKSKISEKQENLDKLKDYEGSIKSINDKTAHIQKIINLTKSQIDEVKKDGSSLKKNIEEKEKDLNSKISKEDSIGQELDKFKDKIKNNDINKKSLKEILEKIEERKKSEKNLSDQLVKSKESISVETHKKNDLVKKIDSTKSRLKNFKLSSGEVCSNCLVEITEDGIEHARKHLEEEVESFRDELKSQEIVCETADAAKVQLTAKANNLDSSIQSLVSRKDELLRDIVDDETIDQRKIHFRQQLDLIKDYRNQLENMPEKSTLESLREKYGKLKEELSKHEEDFENSTEELKALQSSINTLEELKDALRDLSEKYDSAKERIIHIAAEIKNKAEKIKDLKTVKRTVDENNNLLKENNENLVVYNELLRAFSSKGIRAEILENSILELEKEADSLLKKLTDGRMSIEFVTKKEAKSSGSEKTVFEVHINDGEKTLPFAMYSGGEKFRISFVLRIALSKLLLKRANSKLEFLIIDEAVSPLDQNGVEAMMQIIDGLQDEFHTILVITHRNDVKSYFDNSIVIGRDSSGSRIINQP